MNISKRFIEVLSHNRRSLFWLGIAVLIVQVPSFAQQSRKKEYLITLSTEEGEMKLVLSNKTPLHKANFIKLSQEKFYDGLLFHRVIESFMIQGGDPTSRNAEPKAPLGNGSVGYRIPAEFDPTLFHKKGAVAAARDDNPEKASSGCQFYIVQGKPRTGAELEKEVARAFRVPTEAQKEVYRTIGGAPHLDGGYTVFGQVIDGLPVIDAIASRPRDARNRPLDDVPMKVSVKQMRKKKISRKYGYVFD